MDQQTVQKLAAINMFRLTEEEESWVQAEFDRVLPMLTAVSAADFGDTPMMVHAVTVEPVYREDIIKQEISREEILAGAPKQAENCFVVPRVAE